MKGNPKVIAAIQNQIPLELALSAQYHLDASTLKNLGLCKLPRKIAALGEDCEEYVKKLSDRLLFSIPTGIAVSMAAQTADGLTAMFQAALDAEAEIVTAYNSAAVTALEAKDDNTRNLFEHLIKFHEQSNAGKRGGNHIDWLQRKLAQIGEYGEVPFKLQYVK